MIRVVKCGGQVLDDDALLAAFCRDFAALEGPKVLVHGGGALAGRFQKALGIEPVKFEGRRVTDDATLQVVTMVYAGWCNKRVVSLLQAAGCDAIGLSGCDGSVITASKRPPLTLSDGRTVDFGWVGDVSPASVRTDFLRLLLDNGLTPVLCAINHDGAGQLLNTNADTVASSVAAALGAGLTTCFEQPGVLEDRNDPASVIPFIDKDTYASLKARGIVADGMIPKLDQAFDALDQGAAEVRICHSSAMTRKKAELRLGNGRVLEGWSFGYDGPATGEVVFSTSMVGYPESLTDPSFQGQILCVSYPLVGKRITATGMRSRVWETG